jgi:beta-glucosidase
VIGPNANALPPLLGNYFGTPKAPVTVLAGIREAVGPATRVLYASGVPLVEGRVDPNSAEPIAAEFLRPTAGSTERGLHGEYFKNRALTGEPTITRLDPSVDFRWYRGAPTEDELARGEISREKALGNDEYSARWTGQLVPPVSGTYELSVSGDDGYRLFVDGKKLIEDWNEGRGTLATRAPITLEGGHAYDLRLEYFEGIRDAEIHLGWQRPGALEPRAEALAAAQKAEVVVFVGGLSPEIEGEEMKVSLPGFSGGDRTELGLPASQEELLKALHATGKPVVLVLLAGSAVAVNWEQDTLPAIVVAWYPGQRGGNAVADVLFGDVNPAGRLPITFYRAASDLPPFADYAMEGRTYRYFRGRPLYPFGHGLSYTRFRYSDLRIDKPVLGPKDSAEVSLQVENVGTRDGDEVVQLYVRNLASSAAGARKDLRGFQRVAVKRGQPQRVSFRLTPARDLAHYDVAKKADAVEPGTFEIQLAASSEDVRLTGRLEVR